MNSGKERYSDRKMSDGPYKSPDNKPQNKQCKRVNEKQPQKSSNSSDEKNNNGRKKKGSNDDAQSNHPLKNTLKFVKTVEELQNSIGLFKYFTQSISEILEDEPEGTVFKEKQNRGKIRCEDVPCNDLTRVRVKPKNEGSDFIHANYVRLERSNYSFIVTQHPLRNTICDYWAMITNEGVEMIISLVNNPDYPEIYPRETGTQKMFGRFTITCKDMKPITCKYQSEHLVIEIEQEGSKKKSRVEVHHYPYWCCRAVPESPKVVMKILKAMDKTKTHAPLVIQCETGINQSAVIVLTENIWARVDENQPIEIEKLIYEMRSQRSMMMPKRTHFVYAIYVSLYMIRRLLKKLNGLPEVCASIDNLEAAVMPVFTNNMSSEPPELPDKSMGE